MMASKAARTEPITRKYFTRLAIPSPSGDNVLTDKRLKELVSRWTENTYNVSNASLCNAIGSLTDRILAGEIFVQQPVESA